MPATPEKKVKDQVVALLKKAGAYYFFPATHGYGRSGVPDIVACVDGVFLAIECKAGKGKPTALQVRELERIRIAGGVAVVVNELNLDMLPPLLERLSAKGALAGRLLK